MSNAEAKLPKHLLDKANLRGGEYAWRLEDMPEVIEAARQANLLNIGGQLQFRSGDNICEAYHIEVDTYKSVPENLEWDKRVQLSAEVALQEFKDLSNKWNFLEEGRLWAMKYPEHFSLGDESIKSAMCFVWYFAEKNE